MKKLSSDQIFDFIAKNESIINKFEMDSKNQIHFNPVNIDIYLGKFLTTIEKIPEQKNIKKVTATEILRLFCSQNKNLAKLKGNFTIKKNIVKLSVTDLFNFLNNFQNWIETLPS